MTNVWLIVLSVGSFFSGLDPAWIALIGTLMGGVGLKLTEHYLGRKKVKLDEQTQIKSELRQQITDLKTAVDDAEDKEDEWRKKYYELLEKTIEEKRNQPPPVV